MDAIIIKTKNKNELHFYGELAKRLGADYSLIENLEDGYRIQNNDKNIFVPDIDKQQIIEKITEIISKNPNL